MVTVQKKVVNPKSVIDDSPIGAFRSGVYLICYLIIMLDIYHALAMGFAAPFIVKEWGVGNVVLGPVLSAAVVGMGIGGLLVGPLIERTSPKAVAIGATVCFGFFGLITSTSTSVGMLILWRTLTGIGLGAALPTASAILFDFAPSKRASLLMTLSAVPSGIAAIGCGFIAGYVAPTHGWPWIFVAGGVGAIVVAAAAILFLSEPVQFLVARGAPDHVVASILAKVDRSIDPAISTFAGPVETGAPAKGSTTRQILSPYWFRTTLLLWLATVAILAIFYAASGWLPLIISQAGHGVKAAATMSTALLLGGMVGSIIIGFMMDRTDKTLVAAGAFFLAGISAFLVGLALSNPAALIVLLFLLGCSLYGGTAALVPLAAATYPAEARPTGISLMYSVGRIGGIAGPICVGLVMARYGGGATALAFMGTVSIIAAATFGLFKKFGRAPG